ncbi:MAG: hypothetical protein OSB70_14360 [Myxococcota bacterium]|nr:hypothetical protein [Myxococcota bacterium]
MLKKRALVVPLLLASLLVGGCANRTVQQNVVEQYGLTIKLRSQADWMGPPKARGFKQPAQIAAPRLARILGGIEVDDRENEKSNVRERRPAVPNKVLLKVSEGLEQAFAKASPDQEIVVLAVRKQGQHGVFNRKFLTSFTSYIKGEQIYFFFSRVDWPLNAKRAGDRLPEPHPNDEVMPFTTVGNATYQKAGSQGVRVDWRSPEFGEVALPKASGSRTD